MGMQWARRSGMYEEASVFNADERKIAKIAYDVIRKFETQPSKLPSVAHLQKPEVQAELIREVASQYQPVQMELEGATKTPDLAAVVAKTAEIVVQQTIDIPRILVVPKGEIKSGFRPFTLDLSRMRYEAPNETLWAAHLRTNQIDRIGVGAGTIEEQRLEDYVVSGLIDFDDVAYDEHADLLYDLAEQVARHFLSYLSEEDARKVLRLHQKEIAGFIHAQMQEHFWQDTQVGYDVVVTRGFPRPTSSASKAPFDNGDENAKSAAST
jgi:type III restriction enzyme